MCDPSTARLGTVCVRMCVCVTPTLKGQTWLCVQFQYWKARHSLVHVTPVLRRWRQRDSTAYWPPVKLNREAPGLMRPCVKGKAGRGLRTLNINLWSLLARPHMCTNTGKHNTQTLCPHAHTCAYTYSDTHRETCAPPHLHTYSHTRKDRYQSHP